MNERKLTCPPCRMDELRRVIDGGAPAGATGDGLDIVNIAEAMKDQELETARMRIEEIGKLRRQVEAQDRQISLLKQELSCSRQLHKLELKRLAFRQQNQG